MKENIEIEKDNLIEKIEGFLGRMDNLYQLSIQDLKKIVILIESNTPTNIKRK